MGISAAVQQPEAAIAPPAGVFRRYANLTLELAISQFKLKYTGSALGYLWSLFKPAMLFGTTYVMFVVLFKVNDGTRGYGVQLLLGIVIWSFFAECTAASMQSIAGTGHLIRKAYFPRSILVIAASLTSMFTLVINLILVVVIGLLFHQLDLGLRILIAPLLLIELYLFSLGISLLLASLFVQFRDVGHLWEISSQVLFYGSAIVYSMTFVVQRESHAHLTWPLDLLASNPVAQVVEDLRHSIVTSQAPWTFTLVPTSLVWIPYAVIAMVLLIGSLIFRNRSPSFAENL